MRQVVYSALEALGSALPSGIGAIVWLGVAVGPQMIAPLILAMMLGISLVNFAGSFGQRPVVYTVRFFEISMLVGFIDSLVPQLASLGLLDTPAVRLTLVLSACVGAALLQPVFYALRLQRLTRYIPTPAFLGFSNAVALILVLSQIKQVWFVANHQRDMLFPVILIALACLTVAMVLYRFKPRWPAGVLGLAAASVLAMVLASLGWLQHGLPMVMPPETSLILPVTLIDWSVWTGERVHAGALLLEVGTFSTLLAAVMFLNTIIAAEGLSQLDDKPPATQVQLMQLSAGGFVAAVLGALPLSGSRAASFAAMRAGGMGNAALKVMCVLCLICYGSGMLAWLPAAAIIGLLVFDAFCMADRPSISAVFRWLTQPRTRAKLTVMQREDLVIVVVVTLFGALINMIAALSVGVMLGLLLFAHRNERSIIASVRDARALRSNCQRALREVRMLDQHGAQIKCVQLQGSLYFGAAVALRTQLESIAPTGGFLILDWKGVVSFDTTILTALEKFDKYAQQHQVQVLHSSRPSDPQAMADLDRAMEHCENALIMRQDSAQARALTTTAMLIMEETGFFGGLSQSAREQVALCLESRVHPAGQYLMRRGEVSREMHFLVQGRVDVLLGNGGIRVASMRKGAMVGEMGFLDGAPRSADILATEEVVSHVMDRAKFDDFASRYPQDANIVLQNMCSALAERLRLNHRILLADQGLA